MHSEYIERLRNSNLINLPPWMFVTSAELAKALGVHIQTLSNWRLRGKGPTPAPQGWFKGRPSRYNLGHVLSWAHDQAGLSVTPWQINAAWLRDHLQFPDWQDLGAVQKRVQLMMRVSREFRPGDLTNAGREGVLAQPT